MKSNHFASVLRYARRLAERLDAPALRDCDLLSRYVVHKDEDAFTVLVQRHGSMVWGVCKRVLDDPNDADDACQATFLVLLNKSATLLRRESLASWLHGTAWRLARKLKVQAARRKFKEVRHIVSPAPDIQEAIMGRDLRSVLDKEIARLPTEFRDPLILCYLQGKSYAEAARQLGWPEGTVSGRLARARALLRQRLTRRGVALSPTVLVAGGLETAAPAASIRAVERTAHLYLIGQAAVSSSTAVAGLTRSLLTVLKLSKFKTLMAGIVLSCASVAGIGLTTHLLTGGEARQAREETPQVAQADSEPVPIVASKGPRDFYGDPLPPGALARIGSAQLRHAGANLAFSADGRSLISASNDMLLYWDVTSGKLARRLPIPHTIGNDPSSYLSLDGKTFVSAAKDGSAVCVYDASTMRELHRYATENAYAAALSADGKILVLQSASEHSVDIRLLDLTTGKERARLPNLLSNWCSIRLSNDGRLLASSNMEAAVSLWDLESARKLGNISTGGL
ncbi:MAG TPA: sigma-70 family RNA polymerase sigma factor, partial [Gemmataceae bacterium]|nr:sigma-70 family RNA polymerase sigma factor [Gemmataceae bacterium]